MPLKCPACGKLIDTDENDCCQRCGCDLSRLAQVVQAARGRILAATQKAQAGDWRQALCHAEQSWSLRHSETAARLAFLAAAALGETARALRWHRLAGE